MTRLYRKPLSKLKKTTLLSALMLVPYASSAEQMETLVVTASGFEQEIKDAPASISVITSESVKDKPFRDITSVLGSVPGVNITGSGASTDISIRGMDAKYTLILVDGKRVSTRESRPNSDNSGFEQGWLPPLSAIERVEVIRGPMSSLYGSDAMGGVVNVITKKGTDKWSGNVRVEMTIPEDSDAKNTYTTNFSLLGPLIDDTLSLLLYGQYSDRKEDHIIDGNAKQNLKAINGRLSFTPTDTQTFDFDFGRSWQKTRSTVGDTIEPAPRAADSERNNQRDNYTLSHKGTFDYFMTDTFLSYEKNENSVRDMTIKNTEFDTKFIIPLENNMLTVGGKYLYQDLYDGSNQMNPDVTSLTRWSYALYAENEWRIVDNFALTTGIRFNKDENYGNNWNPRIYGVWDINENYTLKGGYSTGYTTPLLRQVVTDWGQLTGKGTGVIIGNPDLKPEKSDSYELSLSYLNEYDMNASITLFYTKFKDKIQTYYLCNTGSCLVNGTSFSFVQSRENVDKAEVKGLELTFSSPITDTTSVTANYTYMNSKVLSGATEGLPLNRTPKHKVNVQFDWAYSDKLNLWSKVTYNGKEIESSSRGAVPGTKYPSHTIFDLGASYKINSQTTLYTGIYNLFDKKIRDEDYGKTLEGRRYWLGLDYQF